VEALDHEEAYRTALRDLKNKGQKSWARWTYD
jgi:hypothetical protein